MQTLYSVVFLIALAGALVICVRRPFAGLLIVAAVTPFYSLLRESSVGSPVFFVWPYLLVGMLIAVMAVREFAVARAARGRSRLGAHAAKIAAFLVILLAGLVEADTHLLRTLFTDASLSAIGAVLSTRSFLALAFAVCALLAALCIWFPLVMRRIEGRFSVVDVAVSVFLLAGLAGIVVTYERNGLIFTGLNGFRYYFALALTYLPARYFMRTPRQHAIFIRVVAVACIVGAAQLLLESYLLNQLRVPFERLPWAGPLAREFGYQPEPRAFFDAPLMPIGFMYMTHVSGLFLLIGFALAAPVLLARDSRLSAHRLEIAAAAAAVIGGIWTARTVLLLLVASFVIAAVLVPSTWRRRAAGVILLCALSAITARWLIPGARYDLPSELAFLSGRAVPNLANAILVDAAEVFGWNKTATQAALDLPNGWTLSGKGTATTTPTGRGRYELTIAAEESVDLRQQVPPDLAAAGETIRAEAFVRVSPGTRAGLQLFDQAGVLAETAVPKDTNGAATLLATAISRGAPIAFDVDVSAGGHAVIEYVLLTGPRGTLASLGTDPPQWTPQGWHVMNDEGESERIAGARNGAVRLTAGARGLDFRYLMPPSLTALTGPMTVTAEVEVPAGQSLAMQFVAGARVVDEVQIRGTGKPARVSVSGIAGGGAISVDLDLPANGRALVRDVRVETARAHASLLRLPLRIEPVGGGEPGIGEPAPDVAATPDAGHPSPSTPPSAPPTSLPPAGTAAPPGAAPVFAAQASQGFKVLMLGRGAEFGTWNQVFYADKTQGEFAVSTYSDTKYLEFFQQFGAIGLASLLFLAIAPLWPAVRVWTSARGSLDRAHIVGLTLVMFVAFASLLHLPSIFKVGFGTVVFMAMAIIAQLGAQQRDA